MIDIDGAWRSFRARVGLHNVCIHDIRNLFDSHAFGEGYPIIGRLLGNRRVETTERYAQLARDSVKESAERTAVSIAAHILQRLRPEPQAILASLRTVLTEQTLSSQSLRSSASLDKVQILVFG